MKRALLIFVLCSLAAHVSAQEDSAEYKVPRNVTLAVVETMGINGLIWSYDRYLREDNYSFYISWRSIEQNLRHGFEWDPNQFKTNFKDHPYHGSTYFNAARSNGLSFWESVPFTFAGSLMWEIAMESEYPSYNDLLATSLGGIALGETLFRFSEQVLDDRATGGSRVWREATGFVLNPIGGFNRLLRGDMWRTSGTNNHIRNPLSGWLAFGTSGRLNAANSSLEEFAPAVELTLHYGDPFGSKAVRLPFDYFTFRMWSSKSEETRNSTWLARGSLVGKHFGDNRRSNLLGLFQHFDYVDNELFKIGSISAGPGLMSRIRLGKDFTLVANPYAGYIFIGGSNNEYVDSYQGRDYNFGWGVKGMFNVLLSHPSYGSIYLDYSYFSIWAREGASGRDRLHVLDAIYMLRVWRGLGAGLEYTYYNRKAHYKEHPDVQMTIKGPRALVSYSI
jgi:hypothetical protein